MWDREKSPSNQDRRSEREQNVKTKKAREGKEKQINWWRIWEAKE